MRFERVDQRDCVAIAAVIGDAFSGPPWNEDWSDEARLLQYVGEGLEGSNALAFALADGQEFAAVVMGHVRHWYNRTEYIIEDVAVRRVQQGCGLGTTLMTQVLLASRELGVDEVGLRTRRDAAAYNFYQKLGFSEQEKDVYFAKRIEL